MALDEFEKNVKESTKKYGIVAGPAIGVTKSLPGIAKAYAEMPGSPVKGARAVLSKVVPGLGIDAAQRDQGGAGGEGAAKGNANGIGSPDTYKTAPYATPVTTDPLVQAATTPVSIATPANKDPNIFAKPAIEMKGPDTSTPTPFARAIGDTVLLGDASTGVSGSITRSNGQPAISGGKNLYPMGKDKDLTMNPSFHAAASRPTVSLGFSEQGLANIKPETAEQRTIREREAATVAQRRADYDAFLANEADTKIVSQIQNEMRKPFPNPTVLKTLSDMRELKANKDIEEGRLGLGLTGQEVERQKAFLGTEVEGARLTQKTESEKAQLARQINKDIADTRIAASNADVNRINALLGATEPMKGQSAPTQVAVAAELGGLERAYAVAINDKRTNTILNSGLDPATTIQMLQKEGYTPEQATALTGKHSEYSLKNTNTKIQ